MLQLAKVSRRVLAGLASRVPQLIDGDDLVFVDVDDTIREVHGYAKQGAGFGYTKVRGLNALITTISTPSTAPAITESSLRRGPTRSGKAADWHLKRALTDTPALVGDDRQVWVRGDAAFATSNGDPTTVTSRAGPSSSARGP